MKSFVNEVFMPQYFDKLNGIPERNRGDGFKVIFEELEAIAIDEATNKTPSFPVKIIETGCMRPGYTMDGDGSSTKLFDEFINFYGGNLLSIDITPDHAKFAAANTSDKTEVICEDSVKTLWGLSSRRLNMLYLDSYDVDFNNPILSNLHHMKEMIAVSKLLRNGTIVAIDDCRFYEGDHRIPAGTPASIVGKGVFVQDFMKDIGASLIFDGYQKVWRI